MDQAPIFQLPEFSYDRSAKSPLRFRNRIVAKPVSGEQTAAIGQNVHSALIDELNYMAYVEHSKRSRDTGIYDQAVTLYNSIARRRKSRFMERGPHRGDARTTEAQTTSGSDPDRLVQQKLESFRQVALSYNTLLCPLFVARCGAFRCGLVPDSPLRHFIRETVRRVSASPMSMGFYEREGRHEEAQTAVREILRVTPETHPVASNRPTALNQISRTMPPRTMLALLNAPRMAEQ